MLARRVFAWNYANRTRLERKRFIQAVLSFGKLSSLEQDSTLRGEIYRALLPKLKSDDPEERRVAAVALKVALLAVDGRDISL